MNTQELIENTMLYSLGLLEDSEIESYLAAFDAAPKSVQMLVREEAERMSDFGDLIPTNEPDPALRELVIAAVRAAICEQENDLRIASGSTASVSATPAIAGRIERHEPTQHTTNQTTTHASKRAQPKLSTSPRVHRLWRASTIGFAAATIALVMVWTTNNQTYNQVAPNAVIGHMYDQMGADVLQSVLFDEGTTQVHFVSNAQYPQADASIIHHESWDKAQMFVTNIEASEERPVRVVAIDEDGNIIREIASFTSESQLERFEIDFNPKVDHKLAIYGGMSEAIENAEPMMSSISSDL